MSLQVEQLEHNMAKLTIEVSAEELEGALQKAYQKQKSSSYVRRRSLSLFAIVDWLLPSRFAASSWVRP